MIGKLYSIVFDAADPRGLAEFYANLTGGKVVQADDGWVDIGTPDDWRLSFQLAPDHVPPRWPDPEAPQQMHLDLRFPDIDAARERAESLGARKIGGDTWHVMADPSGHPFCISAFEAANPSQVFGVTIDTEDPGRLARFYGELLGMAVSYEGDEGMMIGAEGGGPMSTMVLQKVAVHRPPRWPDPTAPQQIHFDVDVADFDEAEAEVLAIGATKLADGGGFRVFADPVGHPFCLVHE